MASKGSRARILYFLATAGLAAILAQPGLAQPGPPGAARIRWSLPEVSETVEAGAAKSVTITLSSTQRLDKVSLWATPSVAPFLAIKPTGFDSITANQPHEVVLTFAAPVSAPAEEHGGTLHVKLGEATVPVPLTIGLRVVRSPK
jgi:hypothetical protein